MTAVSHLQFRIVTPDGVIYEDSTVEKVRLPTTTGEITVLPHHIPLLSVLAPGELMIYKNGQPVSIAVSGGMLEVHRNNRIDVLADTAERAEHIDVKRAEEARQRAIDLMKQEKDTDDIAFAKLQAKIEKELARVRVGRKYRNIPPQ